MGIKCVTKDCPYEVTYDGPWSVVGYAAFAPKQLGSKDVVQNENSITLHIGPDSMESLVSRELLTVVFPENPNPQMESDVPQKLAVKFTTKLTKSILLTCPDQHTNLYHLNVDE